MFKNYNPLRSELLIYFNLFLFYLFIIFFYINNYFLNLKYK